MGFKESMMEKMMGGMSAEERSQMMSGMMDSFFGGMSEEEKKKMMRDMMPKMMGSMMGGSGGMMGMMGMMGGDSGAEKDANPMDMCRTMMSSMAKTSAMATYATPELRALFEEWVAQIEEEILSFVEKSGSIDPSALSGEFKISKESVNYILLKLSEKGKIKLKAEKA